MPGTRAEAEEYAARYAAVYREHNARLVAYARSLTGSATMAEDLAAEAHFRVWRRIQAGNEVDNVAAYLTTTVRNLAAGLGRAQREIARDVTQLPEDPARDGAAIEDPEQRASHVDLITRLLKELPDRWAKALWFAEVEDLPMEAVGERIGATAGTTAVVLTRARERLRQAFLQSQPGSPLSEACEPYWKQMAPIVRGTASARRTRTVTEHCDECDDCRARMLVLAEANTRLPALLGPALLAGVLGGGAWFLPALGAAGAGAAAGTAVRAGSRVGRHARLGVRARLAKRGLSPTKVAAGSVAAVGIAATVATLALGSTDKPTTSARSALQTPPASSQPTAAAVPTTTSSSAAVKQTTAASTPTSAASIAAAPTVAPSTAAPTSAAAQQATQATTASSVAAPTTAATTTTPAAPTSSTAAATIVVNSPSDPASASATAVPTATPTLTPTPTPSQTTASPTPSPTITPSDPSPSSTPTDCHDFYLFEFCVTG